MFVVFSFKINLGYMHGWLIARSFLRGLILLYKAIALSSQYSIWGAFWENINNTLVGGNQIKYSRIRRFINIERKASWRGWLLVSLFSKIGTDVSLLTSLLAGPMTWGNLQPPLVSGNLPGVLGGQEAKYVWSCLFWGWNVPSAQ